MLADERRRAILASLQCDGAVRVGDLAAALSVSEMTVRRDLDVLDSQDLLRKVHGGAVTRHHRGVEPTASEKARHMRAEKVAIAATAAALVGDGMTIAIGAGTTTTELARALRGRQTITVITNSISVFEVLTASGEGDGPVAYQSGGARTPSDALVGPIADAALTSFRVDATFLGVHGLDADAGLTSPNIAEAQTNRALIDIAAKLVVLADHTKYGEVGTNVFARLDQVHTLIVDDGLGVAQRVTLEAQVGELIVAGRAQ
jgi:DeoR/GlpR family transcriptional regulator of sugar metabolism